MTDVAQELMTPHEAARWFRRSPSWLRQQAELLRVRGAGGQPLFHVRVCRAYVLGKLCGLSGQALREAQIKALASACGLEAAEFLVSLGPAGSVQTEPAAESAQAAPCC